MMPLMKSHIFSRRIFALSLILFSLMLSSAALPLADQKPKKDNLQKPIAGPRATALRVTWLFVAPDTGAQKVDRVQIGREMVVAEKSGAWLRVYANTDIQEVSNERDAPLIGEDTATPPISGVASPGFSLPVSAAMRE